MRTTVTLDDDTEQLIRRRMVERGLPFKQVLNDAIRDGLAHRRSSAFTTETASLGRSRVDLDRALQLSGDLEDDDLIRRTRSGK